MRLLAHPTKGHLRAQCSSASTDAPLTLRLFFFILGRRMFVPSGRVSGICRDPLPTRVASRRLCLPVLSAGAYIFIRVLERAFAAAIPKHTLALRVGPLPVFWPLETNVHVHSYYQRLLTCVGRLLPAPVAPDNPKTSSSKRWSDIEFSESKNPSSTPRHRRQAPLLQEFVEAVKELRSEWKRKRATVIGSVSLQGLEDDATQQPGCQPTQKEQSQICCTSAMVVCAGVIGETHMQRVRPMIKISLCRKFCTGYLGKKDMSVA